MLETDVAKIKLIFPEMNAKEVINDGWVVWRRKTQEPLEKPLGKGKTYESAIADAAKNCDNKELEHIAEAENLNFGQALEALLLGKIVRQTSMALNEWLCLVPGSDIVVVEDRPLAKILSIGTKIKYRAHIDLFTSDGNMGPWTPTQEAIFALNWEIIK